MLAFFSGRRYYPYLTKLLATQTPWKDGLEQTQSGPLHTHYIEMQETHNCLPTVDIQHTTTGNTTVFSSIYVCMYSCIYVFTHSFIYIYCEYRLTVFYFSQWKHPYPKTLLIYFSLRFLLCYLMEEIILLNFWIT